MQMINQYLKYGSVFDVDYKNPHGYMQIDEDEAVKEYLKRVELPNGCYLASSGGVDSSIIWCLKEYDSFCVSSEGNSDIKYAKLLNPKVTDIEFEVDLEEELILTANLWDKPHCGKTDPYDHFVYRQYDKIITGEELYHLDLFRILKMKGKYIDRFTKTVEIFSDDEIRELGHQPFTLKLRKDNMFHLEAFLYDCWTKISRKIFFKFDHVVSPFLTDRFINFYKRLPIRLKANKRLQHIIGKRVLPEIIYERKKDYQIDGPNKKFLKKYHNQYEYLITKYLRDKNKNIFQIIRYDSAQKYLSNYKKMWNLLNLSVWLEKGKNYEKCI